MTLHPHTTRAELVDYCLLCHEHGVKSVRVDKATAGAVKALVLHGKEAKYLGVKFKIKSDGTT